MNNLDIRDRKIIVAWSGKVGSAIIDNFSHDFKSILVWNRKWEFDWKIAYRIGSLDKVSHIPDDAIGIISCISSGVDKALKEFSQRNLPTVLLSTWYHKDLLRKYTNIPILKAPNVALPIVELMNIFEEFESFLGMDITIDESHQPGKVDPSGTARQIIDIINSKSGDFNYDKSDYKPDEGISYLWDLTSYRWNASVDFWVSQEHVESWHAYHKYRVEGSILGSDFRKFEERIKNWEEKYQDHNFTWLQVGLSKGVVRNATQAIHFFHNVDGREIYADGLREMLPWFLQQWTWIHEVTDYLKTT